MRLRQVALVARELAPVVAQIEATLGIEVGYRDPGVRVFGLENVVMPVGDTFLKVVAPVEDDTTAGRLLKKRGGDGGYMVIVQSDDIAADRARMAELGVRIVFEVKTEGAEGIHLHPRDVGGAILSLDQMTPPESWPYAGPDWKSHVRGDVCTALAGAELQAADPDARAARWSQVIGRPVGPAREIALDDGTRLRFVPDRDGRGEGVSGVDLAVRDKAALLAAARAHGLVVEGDAIRICGTRFGLVESA